MEPTKTTAWLAVVGMLAFGVGYVALQQSDSLPAAAIAASVGAVCFVLVAVRARRNR